MMSRLLLFSLLVGVFTKIGLVYASDLPSSAIDAEAVKTKRLFFSETQRQEGVGDTSALLSETVVTKSDLTDSIKPAEQLLAATSSTLRYTGVVQSVRGLQILLNGLPWRSGDFDIISARLQLGSDLLEVTLTTGKRYRLAPGETIELVR